jgi:CBS domain-containing protein
VKTVANILERKGHNVVKVSPTTSVIDALRLMSEKNTGSVVVMDGDEFIGIMTERDYSRKVVLKGRNSEHTTVADIMTTDFPRVTKKDTISGCMQILSENNLRYLPVFESEELIGIVSINDLVTETILSQSETINYLQNYIQS